MDHFEMVEKLREKANVTYEEAKTALEACDWDLLDALVYLESEGKVTPQEAGYTTRTSTPEPEQPQNNGHRYRSFGETLGQLGKKLAQLIAKGNQNSLEVSHNGEVKLTLPVTAFVLLLLFMFWWVLPLMVVGLFFGFRYAFRGPQLGRDDVNSAINKVAEAADHLKQDWTNHPDDPKQ